jgi:type I restriction enzyme M protein
VRELFERWRTANAPRLAAIAPGDHPKQLIETLSEELLETFRAAPLLDAYDVYQHLMDAWAEFLQDDVYLIAEAGWEAAARPRLLLDTKDQKTREQPDFMLGKQRFKSDLLPAALLVARYFAAEQAAIEALEAEQGALEQKLEEMKEEHGGEGGLLEEALDEKGNLTRASVAARLKLTMRDADAAEERAALLEYQSLLNDEATAKGRVKAAREALEGKVAARYGTLTAPEIKALVVEEKWLARVRAEVEGEVDRVSQALTGRIRQLEDRYATPLPRLEEEVACLAARVEGHLRAIAGVTPSHGPSPATRERGA